MVVVIDHILAVGCYKRFMFIKIKDFEELICVRISEKLYYYLKNKGVKTSQKLRYERLTKI